MTKPSLHLVTTTDNEQIAVWHLAAKVPAVPTRQNSAVNDLSLAAKVNRQNILLIHGTFSDKRVSLGIDPCCQSRRLKIGRF